MLRFLLKFWALARPYRGRFLLGILPGVVGGLFEPLMIATVVFVYGLIFQPADAGSSLLAAKDIKDPVSLAEKLSHPTDPVSKALWSLLPEQDQKRLPTPGTNNDHIAAVLARD